MHGKCDCEGPGTGTAGHLPSRISRTSLLVNCGFINSILTSKAKLPPPGAAQRSPYSAHMLFSCFVSSYNKQFPFPYAESAVWSL